MGVVFSMVTAPFNMRPLKLGLPGISVVKHDQLNADTQNHLHLTDEDRQLLPPQFFTLAKQLHQNYRHWKHLRDTQQATQATFYLFAKAGIQDAIDHASDAGKDLESTVLLILETNLALATVNSLLITGEDYGQNTQLQDCKESIDTALSTLHEFISTRAKLSESYDLAVESIRQDITNDDESAQYVAYGLKKAQDLQTWVIGQGPGFYVVNVHLKRLQELLTLICPQDIALNPDHLTDSRRIEALLANIFTELTNVSGAAKGNGVDVGENFNGDSATETQTVVFSPNGAYYLRKIYNEEENNSTEATIVETTTGKELSTISYQGAFTAMAFSHNGRYLAVVLDDGFEIFDITQGRRMGNSIPHRGTIKATCFSPDDTHVTVVTRENHVKIIKLKTHGTIRSFSPRKNLNTSICFSPKGTYLAMPEGNQVKIYAIATGHEITALPHGHPADALCFSPDESCLATKTQKYSQITQISTGEVIIQMAHQGKLQAISVTPFGTYAAISLWDHTVKLIKVMGPKGGYNTYTIQHSGSINTVSFSSDGSYLATASSDNSVRLVKVATSRGVTTINHRFNAIALAFATNRAYLASAGEDGAIQLFELPKLMDVDSESEHFSANPQVEETSLVHINKAEAFFRTWRFDQANAVSFYEFMLAQATRDREGLAARYKTPILDVNLLLEALIFLLSNAEKHYQTIVPYLSDLDNGEMSLPGLPGLKDTVSAALSSLYEFVHNRMTLDEESYTLALERFKRDIEADVYSGQLLVKIYELILLLLRYEDIKHKGEFYTVKKMLDELFSTVGSLLSPKLRKQEQKTQPASQVSMQEALQIIDAFNLEDQELVTLIAELKKNDVLNFAIVEAALSKGLGQTIIDLFELLPDHLVDRGVAMIAIRRRRRTHYIGTLMTWTNIANKETVLRILKSAPIKTWWRR